MLFVINPLNENVIKELYSHCVCGEVWVFVDGFRYPYKFRGIQNEDELMRAVMFIMYKDNISRGVYSAAAFAGKFVYCHSQDMRVRHWWALPNVIKFRGYRLDV